MNKRSKTAVCEGGAGGLRAARPRKFEAAAWLAPTTVLLTAALDALAAGLAWTMVAAATAAMLAWGTGAALPSRAGLLDPALPTRSPSAPEATSARPLGDCPDPALRAAPLQHLTPERGEARASELPPHKNGGDAWAGSDDNLSARSARFAGTASPNVFRRATHTSRPKPVGDVAPAGPAGTKVCIAPALALATGPPVPTARFGAPRGGADVDLIVDCGSMSPGRP